jgi:hypothetical protein
MEPCIEQGDKTAIGMGNEDVWCVLPRGGEQRSQVVDILVNTMRRVPDRSYAQTCVKRETAGKTAASLSSRRPSPAPTASRGALWTASAGSRTLLQSAAPFPLPEISTTVGEPMPRHLRYILRPPPMSTKPAKSRLSAAFIALLMNIPVLHSYKGSGLDPSPLKLGDLSAPTQDVPPVGSELLL